MQEGPAPGISGPVTVRDYVGPFEYVNGALSEIHTEEGRWTPAGGYEYFIRDHLGNVRSVVSSNGIVQYSDYDPFGLQLPGLSGGSSSNRLKYNGKEAVGELGANVFDYGARLYDAQIGRWGVPDPLSELSRRFSPFVYGNNNPMRFIDPDGMTATPTDQFYEGQAAQDYFNQVLRPQRLSDQMDDEGGPGPKPKPTGAPGTQQARQQQAQQTTQMLSRGDGITPDYTLDGSFVLGAVLRPVGWLFNAAVGKVFGAGAAEAGGVAGSIRNINKIGGTQNCVNCVISTDATLAGRYASALETAGPTALSVLEREFGGSFTHGLSLNRIQGLVSEAGHRGIVFGNRGAGEVGHVFNVVNQKGVIRFLDGQSGKAAELGGYKNFSFLPTN